MSRAHQGQRFDVAYLAIMRHQAAHALLRMLTDASRTIPNEFEIPIAVIESTSNTEGKK